MTFLTMSRFALAAAFILNMTATTTMVSAANELIVTCPPSSLPNEKCTVYRMEAIRGLIKSMIKTCAGEGSDHLFDDTILAGGPQYMGSSHPGDRRNLDEAADHASDVRAAVHNHHASNLRGGAAIDEVAPQEHRNRRRLQICEPWVPQMCHTTDAVMQFTCCVYYSDCNYCVNYPGTRRRLQDEDEDKENDESAAPVAHIADYTQRMAETCTKAYKELVTSYPDCLGDAEEAACHVVDFKMD
eukprot:CAMPEP_0198115708 /NCGR_PEP_ID=MMETSP1442-20131203/6713_1 /TAXON_ID= /ORGANISM="Craspedostauros australis, Strain CCMP3328" /LENGTH=242 /DNA_ID=CAMNT_0043773259 /DNA_START=991 /DNA_END=1719 /DNA_ORIENTATION=+